jgi:hypothetical protein
MKLLYGIKDVAIYVILRVLCGHLCHVTVLAGFLRSLANLAERAALATRGPTNLSNFTTSTLAMLNGLRIIPT